MLLCVCLQSIGYKVVETRLGLTRWRWVNMMAILVRQMTVRYMLNSMVMLWRSRTVCTVDERLALSCNGSLSLVVRNFGGDVIRFRQSRPNCPGCSNPSFALDSGPKKLLKDQL